MIDPGGVPGVVLVALAGVYGLLALASALVWAMGRGERSGTNRELALRVRSWWWIITAFTVAIVIDRVISTVFLAFISYLALKEYLSLIPTRRIDRAVLLWAYLAIPAQFYLAHIAWYGLFIIFIPVWMFLFFPMLMALRGETGGFLRAVGTLSWGLVMTVFTLSHMAYLLASGDSVNPAGGAGLLFFLVFLTQFNDVAQFVSGRLLGRRPIVPSVSPRKTWEGFLGGLFATAATAALIGPHLTMMDGPWSALAGAIIAVAGFLGDVTLSAVKRDLGVKDSGAMIPGHGGVLDRVDSLTYSAPVFFHLLYYFFYP
ncbi:MAG TPA: phosphatidate cytidylyltransferase [Alphaproteobacteria bacterium]